MTQAIRVVSRIQDQDDVDNVAPSDGVILVGDGDKFIADALEHTIGGDRHSASTLAELNSKISDATLDDSGSARPPTAHASTHATAGSDPLAPADIGGIPLIDPATPGNLVTVTPGGTLVDAGYAADVDATAGSVVRRTVEGKITTITTTGSISDFGIIAQGSFLPHVLIVENLGNVPVLRPSGLRRDNGTLEFLGDFAAANRLAQLNEINGVAYVAQSLTGGEQAQARANIDAETAGAAATVQSNLNTHTGDATIHYTQAAINITPAQAGADPAGSAAAVAGDLSTHEGLTGTDVHDLGSASTLNAGTTGAAVVQTETVEGALIALNLPVHPPITQTLHAMDLTYDVVGSGGFSDRRRSQIDIRTDTTPNSSSRAKTSTNALLLGYTATTWNWKAQQLDINGTIVRTSANPGGVLDLIWGKQPADALGIISSGNYVGFRLENVQLVSFYKCVSGTVTQFPLAVGTASAIYYWVKITPSEISLYIDNVLQATLANDLPFEANGAFSFEISNGASGNEYRYRMTSQVTSRIF